MEVFFCLIEFFILVALFSFKFHKILSSNCHWGPFPCGNSRFTCPRSLPSHYGHALHSTGPELLRVSKRQLCTNMYQHDSCMNDFTWHVLMLLLNQYGCSRVETKYIPRAFGEVGYVQAWFLAALLFEISIHWSCLIFSPNRLCLGLYKVKVNPLIPFIHFAPTSHAKGAKHHIIALAEDQRPLPEAVIQDLQFWLWMWCVRILVFQAVRNFLHCATFYDLSVIILHGAFLIVSLCIPLIDCNVLWSCSESS